MIRTAIFDCVKINPENGKTFTIRANNPSSDNKYIQAATPNGTRRTKSWFNQDAILNGSELAFGMGSSPIERWGTAKEDRPSTR